MTRKACPTCGTWQDFRKLDDAEKAAVRKEKGPRHYVHDLWRCTAVGCLWYQPWHHTRGGDRLPEEFRKEAAADT
ncbi:hypothetical protein ADK57_17310 [Streptomyces sp. MMG1533]|uniref:hypothetical protein n=1 Tax=Streptomyces sp. MMG1533 TaxID=1415546 RepID=UPI0006B06447|nr:hypothetical protein [Streptomyces sp. MMG1533]KOU67321.1 hypothetical protein ADK57_17310 [Streptomyces sp. MMG1533]